MTDADEFTLEDAAHEFREALVKRVAAVMGWPYKTSPVWAGLRKVAMAEGVVVGVDKLEEIVVRLEAEAGLRHGCLAALGFLAGVSILTKEQLQKTLVDAVKAGGSPEKWSDA